MRIDSHQHFWALERGDYDWLTPDLGDLYRDFLPRDLHPFLKQHNIDGTILVQAAPTEAETSFMLTLAEQHAFIKGVVGWVDFENDKSAEAIKQFAEHSAAVGLRPMIQDIPDVEWMLKPSLAPAYQALIDCGLVFDALVFPKHLTHLLTLVKRYPGMKVVIDHCAKPSIADQEFQQWSQDIAALAAHKNVYCKLSGLVTEAKPDWKLSDLSDYSGHIIQCFGANRVLWGSDWPVCTLRTSYQTWYKSSLALINSLTAEQQSAVMGSTAAFVYGIS